LVDLEKAINGIVLDIRYATPNNFTHQTIYPAAKAFLRKPVAEALLKVQQELKGNGNGGIMISRVGKITRSWIYPSKNYVTTNTL